MCITTPQRYGCHTPTSYIRKTITISDSPEVCEFQVWLENGGLATEVAAALSSSGGDQVVEEVAAALVHGST